MIAQAQTPYPSKPIRLVVPFTPGGVTDTSGRLIAEQLSKRLGQQVGIDNKSGASGNIGTQLVASAEPDGYTLLLAFDGTMVINPHVFEKVPFDTLKDFAPIGKIGDAVLILVAHPGLNAKTLKEVITLSQSQSGGLSYGTSGTGGTPHIAGELLKLKTNANGSIINNEIQVALFNISFFSLTRITKMFLKFNIAIKGIKDSKLSI